MTGNVSKGPFGCLGYTLISVWKTSNLIEGESENRDRKTFRKMTFCSASGDPRTLIGRIKQR